MDERERTKAIKALRRRHSAKAQLKARIRTSIKEGAIAGGRAAAERAIANAKVELTVEEVNQAVRAAIVALSAEFGRQCDRRVDALAELLPLLDDTRKLVRARGASRRAEELRPFVRGLAVWRRRYQASDTADQIMSWLLNGDREQRGKILGRKKGAEGVAYKVVSRLTWVNTTVRHIGRVYRNAGSPRRNGWWESLRMKLI